MSNTVAFDPGYGQYLTSFINTIEYMYGEINKFKNLGQKKFKFKTFYPQILALIEQNTAFYLGCMLWAIYVKSQNNATLTGNHCLGQEYNEELELMEINYMVEFINHFDKDTKYYLNKTFDYCKTKKYNICMIDTKNHTDDQIINVKDYKHTHSILLITSVIQAISAFVPENNGTDPNRDANNDYTDWMETRVL